ncbi:MAG: hypothetical protein J0M01_02250 [Dechloromonas sp.]|jgi:hypothetical protein|nr:hypothetical protein [Dechloromonas sp.]
MANTKPLHIFRPGRHTAMSGAALEFSEADLAASAAAYDPALSEAPIVVGHPATDGPAYGWVKSLSFAGGGLEAEPDQVDPAFADMVAAGRFKKISASFYPPASPHNPAPGVYYLRHVGFLGAQPPAVKGLRAPAFAEGDDAVTVELEFSEPHPKETSPVTPDEKAALEAENAQLKERLAASDAALLAQKTAQIHAGHAAFAEGLVSAGQMVPAQQAVAVALLDTLAAQETPVEFGEGDARAPLLDAFKAFLAGLPKRVEFSETATGRRAAATGEARVEFAAPQGYGVDAEALATHRKALAWQAEHQTDYLTAVRAVAAH